MAFTKDDLRHFFRLGYDSGRTAEAANLKESVPRLFDDFYARFRKDKQEMKQAAEWLSASEGTPALPYCEEFAAKMKASMKARLKP